MAGEHRPVRHFTKSQMFCVFCSGVGSHGCGHRRYAPAMGPYSGVCISSFCYDTPGLEQAETVSAGGDNSHSASLETERVVSGLIGTASGAPSSTSHSQRPSEATSFSSFSSQPCHASSSCVASVQRFARAAGFSARVAAQLARSRRKSSLDSYQSKWKLYRSWCTIKGHSVSNPSVPKIAEFLLWLWEKKKFSLPTVKAYRSMLTAVFKFKIPTLSEDPFLKDLVKSFAIERPRSRRSFPDWDLNKVLSFLSSERFEPLEEKDLRTQTMKVLFLVALATARRVGELQALSNRVPSLGEDLILSYLPSFVAKTESVSNPLPRSFPLKSLRDFAGDLEEGTVLCPVRALLIYLKVTRHIVSRPLSLFVSPKKPTRSISKNAISFFLRKVIFDAGAMGENEGPLPRAHSIRGVATSVAFLKNCSISRVLEAATWKSNSVFSLFYFKDMQYVLEGTKSLGPFVAAGEVIS